MAVVEEKIKRKVGRPGRKKVDTEAKDRRTAQNRAAQRAFRERKEVKLKSLENKISNLEKISEQSELEASFLKEHMMELINEMTKFRPQSSKDTKVLSFLKKSNMIKDDLRLQNMKEDEAIEMIDSVGIINGKEKTIKSTFSNSNIVSPIAEHLFNTPVQSPNGFKFSKNITISTEPSSSSEMEINNDIVENLLNASYSINSDQTSDPFSSPSSSSLSNTNIFPNFTNQFPVDQQIDSNAFSAPYMSNVTDSQFSLNSLTNTWNNFNTIIDSTNGITPSSHIDLGVSELTQEPVDNTNQFLSFLDGNLAFPEMNDNVLYREPIATVEEDYEDNCACHSDDECHGEIKCDLITRHILNGESIQTILKDPNFINSNNKDRDDPAYNSSCDGKSCSGNSLPYDKNGKLMKCSEVWRHITTLPKYTEVDIDNLANELMTKVNYSDKGITIKLADLENTIRKQTILE